MVQNDSTDDLHGMIKAVGEFQSDMTWAYQVKGHVDKAAFLEGLAVDYGFTTDEDKVEHAYERCVPYCCEGEKASILLDVEGPGRGVFPVTRVLACDCRDVIV